VKDIEKKVLSCANCALEKVFFYLYLFVLGFGGTLFCYVVVSLGRENAKRLRRMVDREERE